MRSRVNVAVIIAVLALFALSARAQQVSLLSPPGEPDPLAPALNAAYNVEYQKAQLLLNAWLKEHPEDYRAWNYLAEAVLNEEMVKESLFSGNTYLNGGKVFQSRGQPLPDGFSEKLNTLLDRAETFEQRRLKQNSKDEDALYWLGVTYSTRAEFDFVLLRSYFAALREGRKAWQVNRLLLKLNPRCADALFVLGIADYAGGILPWYAKMLTALAGIHGSVPRGIAELRSSERGRYTRVDAKIVLVAIYEREKMYGQALDLLRQLENEFPENYLSVLEAGRVYEMQGDWRGAAGAYDTAVVRLVRDKPDLSRSLTATILYRDAQAHEHLGDLAQALDLYHEAAKQPVKSLDVYRAEMAAAALDRKANHLVRARQEYQRVIEATPNTSLGTAARQALQELH